MSDEGDFKLPCGHTPSMCFEYSWDSPEHYDGISEYECGQCQKRWGRWTLKEICVDYPAEPPYGIERKPRDNS